MREWKGIAVLILGAGSATLFAAVLLRSQPETVPEVAKARPNTVERPAPPPSRPELPPRRQASPEERQRADEARRKAADSLSRDLADCLKRADAGRVPGLIRALRPFGDIGIKAVEEQLSGSRDSSVRLGLQDAVEKLRKPAE